MNIWIKVSFYAALFGFLVLLFQWHGWREYDRGKRDAQNAAIVEKSETQTKNAGIWKDTNHEIQKIPDSELDAAASRLGILRPDASR